MTIKKHSWSLRSSGSSTWSFEWWSYVQHKDFQLHLLQKPTKACPTRPTIPTTERQRLACFRGYCTVPCKLQIIHFQPMQYNTFFWLYMFNVVFRSLPTNYIHVFLAAYNPDDHLFGSKMYPLLHGTSWQAIVCAMTQLLYSADILSIFLFYAVFNVLDESLLGECDKEWITSTIRCHTIEEFRNLSLYHLFEDDKDIELVGNYYKFNIIPRNGTNSTKPYLFTVAPLYNFMKYAVRTNVLEYESYSWIALYLVIWVAAGMFYKQLYRDYIWKIFDCCQICMCLIYLATVLYIMLEWLETDAQDYNRFSSQSILEMAKRLDLDFHGESITGPPIVHILTARSSDEVNPGRDSFMITISNSAMYFLKILANYKVKSYVESKLLAPVRIARSNPFPVFYFWPFFFNNFYIGSSISKVFFMTSFVMEFMTFMVTYQMLVEVLVSEWSWAWRSRRTVTVALSCAGLILCTCMSHMTRLFLYIITTRVTSATEAILVCWCYSLDRLLDDVHFWQGTAVRKWRKWSLKLLPWYYIFKLYIFSEEILGMGIQHIERRDMGSKQFTIMSNFSGKMWCWAVPILPLLLGAMFAIYKYLIIEKQYIGSQASRYLSRHLLANAQTPTYRLDLRYSTATEERRTTLQPD